MIIKFNDIQGMNQNTYLLIENNKCVMIDCSSIDAINYIKENNLICEGCILTHGHFDHCMLGNEIRALGIKIYIHKLDADKLYTDNNLSKICNVDFNNFVCDEEIEQGILKLGDFDLKIIHTPGHSEGSICIKYKNNIFTGDTIFENGYGRVDFYDSSAMKLRASVKLIKSYGDCNLFYGHSY